MAIVTTFASTIKRFTKESNKIENRRAVGYLNGMDNQINQILLFEDGNDVSIIVMKFIISAYTHILFEPTKNIQRGVQRPKISTTANTFGVQKMILFVGLASKI